MVIVKKRAAIKPRARRLRAKMIAERRFLCNKTSKRVSKVLQQCPDIGKVIETYVQDQNIGADAWRYTGVLTFDYVWRRKWLMNVYVVVWLRSASATFHLELQLSSVLHAINATDLQKSIMELLRRLQEELVSGSPSDTTPMHIGVQLSTRIWTSFNMWMVCVQLLSIVMLVGSNSIHLPPASSMWLQFVRGQETLTTRTDFVNKHLTVIQITSYNFTGTGTTPERCVGVVKAVPLHHKNPAQHAADLAMIQAKDKLSSVFLRFGS